MNPMKTKVLVFSRSKTLALVFPNLLLDGTVVERVTDLKVLEVVLDIKLAFVRHIRSIANSACSKLGIMRKALYLFGDLVFIFEVFLKLPASCVRVLLSCLNVCCSFYSRSS
mgnify:CR=1 FL=1